VFVNRILRRIFGPKWKEVVGNYMTRSFMVPDLLTRRMRWTRHVAPRRELKYVIFW
jgi:hypothetical protein